MTVLIGDNGAGKSTVVSLLTRMYEPSAGKILFGTKKNNICLYQNVAEEELWLACRDFGLEEFVREVSFSYMVGQNGAKLSGGQKQKIALARALVHDRPIVILDEVTSSTDAYSSEQIVKLLKTHFS